MLVHKGKARRAAHLFELAEAEAEQDAALHPGVDAPRLALGLRRAKGARFKLGAQLVEGGLGFRAANGGRSLGKPMFDNGFKCVGLRHILPYRCSVLKHAKVFACGRELGEKA